MKLNFTEPNELIVCVCLFVLILVRRGQVDFQILCEDIDIYLQKQDQFHLDRLNLISLIRLDKLV